MEEQYKYYFTFVRRANMPFEDGYIIIWAKDYCEAMDIFNSMYEPYPNGAARYDNRFTRFEWKEYDMRKWGVNTEKKYCHGEFNKHEQEPELN